MSRTTPSTFRRNLEARFDGRVYQIEVVRRAWESHYRVHVALGSRDSSTFTLPGDTKSVLKVAQTKALGLLSSAKEKAADTQTYVVVQHLPGYAHSEVPDEVFNMVPAAYWMDHTQRMAVSVYRLNSGTEADLAGFTARVDGKRWYESGDQRHATLAKVSTTTSARQAFGGHTPYDAISYFQWRDGVSA